MAAASDHQQNQDEDMLNGWTGLQHLSKLCEHIPLIGVLAQMANEKLAEGWRRIVYGVISAVVGAAVIAVPSVMWAQYRMFEEAQREIAVMQEKVKHLQTRTDSLKEGQNEQTDLLRDLRMQIMRMQEAERLRNK